MSRDDEAGAIAAATYFLATLYGYTEWTQDTGPWTAMSHEDCIFCRSVLDEVGTQLRAGTATRVAPIDVDGVNATRLNPLTYEVTLSVTTGPDEVYGADGSVVDRGTGGKGAATLIVIREELNWIVRGVSLERDT